MMDEKEMMNFSWTGRFLVTGFSCFLFSMMLKILDGDHSRFLVLTGTVTLILGLLNWAGRIMSTAASPKKERESSLTDF